MSEQAPVQERITTGIDELDEMLDGGLMKGHVVVLAGPSGGGKTIATLQFIHANLLKGKRCLYISAADDIQSILDNALQFGWSLQPYLERGRLQMEYMELMEIELGSKITSDFLEKLPAMVEESGAEIVVVDSITEFNDLCTSEIERRGRLLNLRRIVKNMGGTAILTAETHPDGDRTKYGIAEYASDGLILQRHYQPEDFSLFLYIMQIKKMRWIKHSRDMRSYSITDHGITIQSPLYTILASAGKIR